MSSSAFGHQPGKGFQCLSLAIVLKKEEFQDQNGQKTYRIGFSIGGGIDLNPEIEPNSPAYHSGLQKFDKILQVNGTDYTMLTHDKAVKYIKKDPVLNMLIARP